MYFDIIILLIRLYVICFLAVFKFAYIWHEWALLTHLTLSGYSYFSDFQCTYACLLEVELFRYFDLIRTDIL